VLLALPSAPCRRVRGGLGDLGETFWAEGETDGRREGERERGREGERERGRERGWGTPTMLLKPVVYPAHPKHLRAPRPAGGERMNGSNGRKGMSV